MILSKKLNKKYRTWSHVSSFERFIFQKKEESGDDGVVDTPVPIPNTEVKHHSGDDSVSKSSTLPVLFFYPKAFLAFFNSKSLNIS